MLWIRAEVKGFVTRPVSVIPLENSASPSAVQQLPLSVDFYRIPDVICDITLQRIPGREAGAFRETDNGTGF